MTGYLPQDAYQYVRAGMLEKRKEVFVSRKIIPVDPNIAPSDQEAKRWNFIDPEEEADLIPKGGDYPLITTSATPTTVPIHQIGAGHEINDWDALSSNKLGAYSVARKMGEVLGEKLAKKEDRYIFNGDTSVNVTGVYASAGNTKGCTTQWAASGGEPYEDVNEAVGKLEADKFNPKFLIMHPENMFLLRQEDAYGNVYKEKILKNTPITADNILTSEALTKGTALLCDAGSDIAELKIAEDARLLPEEKIPGTDKSILRARARIGIDIYETDAFCTITNISAST
jgi:uncharacterized linocin/CFP29 family protein